MNNVCPLPVSAVSLNPSPWSLTVTVFVATRDRPPLLGALPEGVGLSLNVSPSLVLKNGGLAARMGSEWLRRTPSTSKAYLRRYAGISSASPRTGSPICAMR
jgi:hypothetical protein